MKDESFICVCGKKFNSIKALYGHKAGCKEFYLQRDGNLDNYYKHKDNVNKSLANFRKSDRKTLSVENKRIQKAKEKIETLENWILEQHKCERCGKVMTEYFGSGRFCSRACSNSHYLSQKTREKISKSLSNKIIKKYCIDCGKLIRKSNKSGYCGECYFKHRIISEETRHKLSVASTGRCSGGFHHNHIEYNGINLDSSYELIVAKSLDENNIAWIRPKPLKYVDAYNKEHNYIPDFYLPEYNVYLDPKNDFLINNVNPNLGFSDVDKIKWVMQQNNAKVIILNKEQLTWSVIKTLI